jgi:hypothetical protein
MNQHISICNFEIPVECLPPYKAISKEFEKTVRDAARPVQAKEVDEALINNETRKAMMAMLGKF